MESDKKEENKLVRSVETTQEEGWFLVNNDLKIRFFTKDDEVKMDVECNQEDYTDEDLQEIASEVLQIVMNYYENETNQTNTKENNEK